ncbi:MAG TPA: excinuclease ABC subunit UvrB [Candidatus Paceibacterota bacterium]|nr:excinuclease ABC subunit UvrB [Candidatus Pacearchaeota archaeon]HRZ50586.1 excinuclease ABC subunit UvrB [Candidatus Paceibacterota bacterium]HSA36307.1 excinuclease ABC subunit UvrB [Candidatus Paceibacterota bacterium]
MYQFKVVSKFEPQGDQPRAIKKLVCGIKKGLDFQTLLGVTGSGKTFTMAKLVEEVQRPTLVISPNKTLAAQLYEEFKNFFPTNAVSYFVSFYDYYQPEAYIPQTDTYIEKDSKINEEIDRMRHETVQHLLTRRDSLVVASVSCIYNLGSPETYRKYALNLAVGQNMAEHELFGCLLDLQYERNDYDLWRGKFRKRMNYCDIWLSGDDRIVRVEIENQKIKTLYESSVPFGKFIKITNAEIWPAKFWLSDKEKLNIALSNIGLEMQKRQETLKSSKKLIEAERIKRRTEYDMSMMRETGYCHGIENYSRHIDFREPDSAPYTLLDYFPKDYLVLIDESHITVPQIRGMQIGDHARKKALIEYGFRLPSAYDNRPLKYEEFLAKLNQTVFVSATPGEYEKDISENIAEQIVRPTFLLDPEIEIRPSAGQIEDLLKEIEIRKAKNQRVLALTITKRLSEALSDHLKQKKIKAEYLHSEIKTLARPKILADLRKGKYDVLVGINLLREGLDLPEVSLIAIFDADKEGFLRDETSLVQIIGRTSRHREGKIIMYADRITASMKKAISETDRRRAIQAEYNRKHNAEPMEIVKDVYDSLSGKDNDSQKEKPPSEEFLKDYLRQLNLRLDLARRNLQFEKAARIKEKIDAVKEKAQNLEK